VTTLRVVCVLEIMLPCVCIQPPAVEGGRAGVRFDDRAVRQNMDGILEELGRRGLDGILSTVGAMVD
jgi:hypothetical protein